MPKRVLNFCLLLCFLAAFFKGWLSLAFVPAALLALPVVGFFHYLTNRFIADKRVPAWISTIQWVQLLSMVALFLFTPGYGDSDQTTLFGFYKLSDTSALAHAARVISSLSLVVSILSFIALLAAVGYYNHLSGPSKVLQKPTKPQAPPAQPAAQ